MGDSDKTLKLRIELDGYVMPGVAEAEEKLETEAEALAKSMGVVNVSAADADKIIQGFGNSTKESAGHTAAHTGQARAMHMVFHELNRIVPGLGTALRAAFHPDMIGIFGALLAFQALKSVLEDIKAIDSIKPADFVGSKDAIDAVKDSYEKAAVAAQLFVDEQNRLNHAGASAEEVQKRQTENYKNLATAQDSFNSAQKKLGESQIDEREKQGLITHANANKEKFALDVEYARKKLLLEAQIDAAELAAKTQQLATEKAQLAAALKDQGTDESNAAAAAAAKTKHDNAKETALKNVEAAKKTLEELGKSKGALVSGEVNDETAQKLEEYYQKYVGGTAGKSHSEMFSALRKKGRNPTSGASLDGGLAYFMAHTVGQQSGAPAFAKYDDAKQQMASGQSEIKRLEGTQFNVDLNAERGKKQLESTDDAVRKLSASTEKLAVEIPQQKADNQARLNNAAGVQNLELRADAAAKGLHDPGNTFVATAQPVMSAAHEEVTNATPWREKGAVAPSGGSPNLPAQSVNSIMAALNKSHDHAATIATVAAQIEKQQHSNHELTLRILGVINTGVGKHESLAQIVSQLEAQQRNSRNNHGK